MCAGGCFFFTERRGRGRKEVAETSGGGGQVKEGRLSVVAACLSACFTLAGYLLAVAWRPLTRGLAGFSGSVSFN